MAKLEALGLIAAGHLDRMEDFLRPLQSIGFDTAVETACHSDYMNEASSPGWYFQLPPPTELLEFGEPCLQ